MRGAVADFSMASHACNFILVPSVGSLAVESHESMLAKPSAVLSPRPCATLTTSAVMLLESLRTYPATARIRR